MTTVSLISRRSGLAIAQSVLVKDALISLEPSLSIELHYTDSLGDKYRGKWEELHQGELLTKRKWTFELEESVADGSYHFAIHSGKDLPFVVREGTLLIPVLERADPRDVLITKEDLTIETLRPNARIGTKSLRRTAQLKRLRPDLEVIPLEGNIDTRVRKLRERNDLDGIVLAAAGLSRYSVDTPYITPFTPEQLVPAMNQGILVAQCRADDKETISLLSRLSHHATARLWEAQIACASLLQVSCDTAIGVYGEFGEELSLTGRGLSHDGAQVVEKTMRGVNPRLLGEELARALIAEGIREVMAS